MTIQERNSESELASRRRRKALIAGSVGNTVEWIDWALYSALAPVFASQFFPPASPAASLLATLAVFAVGFLMRPVGGALIGVFTDRHGRKKGLTLTIVMMAGCAFVIALCPTYAQIGVAAPIILLLARLVQGFSAGGEFGSSSSLLVESATGMRRAFAGSWQQVSAGLGVLIAAVLSLILTSTLDAETMSTWGWRAAFIGGGLLGLVGLWLRIGLDETDSFRAVQAEGRVARNPLTEVFRKHPREALRVIGMAAAGVLIYYIWINYMPGYVSAAIKTMDLQTALVANTIALAYFLCLLPFVGILADRVGRKPVMITFAGGFVVFAYPAFFLLGTGGFWTLFAVEMIGVTLLAGYAGLIATVMAEQFPAEVRTTGIGFPYAIAVAVFGGTAPYVTTWLATSGLQDWVWLYVAAAALFGLVVYARMPETRDRVLT
ncbi:MULTISPECIES: MFS transporter [Rhodococcus]|uniref:Putative proline/betaine transporter n=1 Tax=Rhodococcus oxybenzonivorans TaxID=1990687 RepID=A0AAE4V2U8_9NOCA|nr:MULTISPECIES: MFS transporter [Rhodococcus]MDV7245271.1 MFS transporter [Rhodococcus oxybenzonivorans]MDV7267046.1 MFS transporter [Rhodococcus oxybenzonivorans]MDV7272449.1 MFS transporter [Rhodococcus oxybenzonivorans]MDV7336296.1 MFS transporter [Rhodococcus oxybenzonivorans]MDV7342981.1 MFS transporter [Rhodococcus oxybenzonivorans]